MLRKRTQLMILMCLVSILLAKCTAKDNAQNTDEAMQADSIINVRNIADRIILVSFGYDAISAINTEEGIILIDAGISTGLASLYKKRVETEFKNDEFLYVINTHGHNDHIGGNAVFRDARIIGHKNVQAEDVGRWSDPAKAEEKLAAITKEFDQQMKNSETTSNEWVDAFTQKLRYMSALADVRRKEPARFPDITFSDSLKIDLKDTSIEMIWFGDAHSSSDIIIYVPERNVLFTGDLFSKYGRPGFDPAEFPDERHLKSISWLERRMTDSTSIIDGHGQILTAEDLRTFCEKIRN